MILITGAAGFIGFHVSKLFLKKKYRVIGIDNMNNYYDNSLKKNRLKQLKKYNKFKFYDIDISNNNSLSKVFTRNKLNFVIHLAAQPGVRYSIKNPRSYIKSNLNGFFNVLDQSKKYKVKHFIYASSSSVYGANTNKPFSESDNVNHPIQLYAATKRSNELIAHSYSSLYNLKTTGLRFFTVYGPWGRPDMAVFKFTDKLFKNQKIKLYNFGKNTRDFTYIDDVTNAIFKIFINKQKKLTYKKFDPGNSIYPFQIFNIGNSKGVSTKKLIKILQKTTNKEAKLEKIHSQPGEALDTCASTEKTYRYFKFKPNTKIEDGIKKFVTWYKSYYKHS